MNKLSALHAQTNATVRTGLALESEVVAMEGFIDTVKARWTAIKESVKPSDHEGIVQKLSLIPRMKEDLAKLKTTVSNGDEAEFQKVTAKVNKMVVKLPVTATTPMQVIVEMEKMRRGMEVIGRKAQLANTPEKLKEVREAFNALKGKPSKVNPNMVWTKDQVLKLFDELGRYADTSLAVGKLYLENYAKAKREQPKAAMECFSNAEAMEAMDDITSFALESFVSSVSGLVLLFAAIFLCVLSYMLIIQGVLMLLAGAFVPGLIAIVLGLYGREFSHGMADKAVDEIYS